MYKLKSSYVFQEINHESGYKTAGSRLILGDRHRRPIMESSGVFFLWDGVILSGRNDGGFHGSTERVVPQHTCLDLRAVWYFRIFRYGRQLRFIDAQAM